MKTIIYISIIADIGGISYFMLALIIALAVCCIIPMLMMRGKRNQNSGNPNSVYTCPIRPEVKSDKPGKCPKSGMDLVKS